MFPSVSGRFRQYESSSKDSKVKQNKVVVDGIVEVDENRSRTMQAKGSPRHLSLDDGLLSRAHLKTGVFLYTGKHSVPISSSFSCIIIETSSHSSHSFESWTVTTRVVLGGGFSLRHLYPCKLKQKRCSGTSLLVLRLPSPSSWAGSHTVQQKSCVCHYISTQQQLATISLLRPG